MKKILSTLAISLALSACDNNDVGNKFVGTWYMDNPYGNRNAYITISRYGDKYQIKTNLPEKDYCNLGATLESNELVCSPQTKFTLDINKKMMTIINSSQATINNDQGVLTLHKRE